MDGTVQNARLDTTSIPLEPVGARSRKLGAPPPAHGPPANGEAAELAKQRSSLLDLACETLAGMEIGAHHCSARDGHPLAPPGLQALLALEVAPENNWPL